MTYVRRQLRLMLRDTAYLTVGLATSVVAFAVWVTGVSVFLSLAVFIIGIPAFIVAAIVFRWTADLDRRNAARVLGTRIQGAYRDHPRRGLLTRFRAYASDPQTWRDLVWLVVHSIVGFGFGVAVWTGISTVLGVALLPLWYWTLPDTANVGLWQVDTLGGALAVVPFALPLGALLVALTRAMALVEARLASALLSPAAGRGRLREHLRDPQSALALNASIAAVAGFICTLIWGLTGHGYFWPGWVWFGLAIEVGLHALWVHRRRLPWLRERQLVQRVDELTRTRRGALDVQAAELRRIERDLHDGAQARLVSLSMLIGRAEDQVGDDPEAAALMRQAREEASAAIGELRDLARGIAPPVLADRGLVAAVESLAARAPVDVAVEAPAMERLPPVVETAAYFVVSESLTNVAKHAPGAAARVRLARERDELVVEVADDGPGGANPQGSGLSGLRRRVEALDGELRVESAPGAGTTVHAELPCGS